MEFETSVTSMEEQAQLAIAAFVKGLAVEAYALDGLPGELAVMPRDEKSSSSGASKKKVWTFSKDCLIDYVASRELAGTLCSKPFTGQDVITMLKKREAVLLQADSTFKVDLTFLSSLTTSTGVTLLSDKFEQIIESHNLSSLADAVPDFSRLLGTCWKECVDTQNRCALAEDEYKVSHYCGGLDQGGAFSVASTTVPSATQDRLKPIKTYCLSAHNAKSTQHTSGAASSSTTKGKDKKKEDDKQMKDLQSTLDLFG
eukprot:6492521-Amphidinium_carterae.1